jgi:hypothetical protein
MAARKWTTEQRERQAALIRTWAPWTASTGPRTPKGKQISAKNAVNYSLREVMREIARQNRTLIGFINGTGSAPTFDRTVIDGLLDDLERGSDTSTQKAKIPAASLEKC